MKCPYCILEDGSDVRAVKYLKEDDNRVVTLNREHDYFYQVQCQMMCTGHSFGDFFVWSPQDTYIERIVSDNTV